MVGFDLIQWRPLFDWAVSTEITGILQWLGTLITVVGLPLTFRQSWKAKIAAREATKAVAQFQSRITTVTIAHSYSHLEMAKSFISSQNYAAASSVVGILKRAVLQSANLLENASEGPTSLSQGRRNIARIEHQIALAIRDDPSFKPATLDRAVRGLGECLIDWEHWILTQKSGSYE